VRENGVLALNPEAQASITAPAFGNGFTQAYSRSMVRKKASALPLHIGS